jgi:hypothetical protein
VFEIIMIVMVFVKEMLLLQFFTLIMI